MNLARLIAIALALLGSEAVATEALESVDPLVKHYDSAAPDDGGAHYFYRSASPLRGPGQLSVARYGEADTDPLEILDVCKIPLNGLPGETVESLEFDNEIRSQIVDPTFLFDLVAPVLSESWFNNQIPAKQAKIEQEFLESGVTGIRIGFGSVAERSLGADWAETASFSLDLQCFEALKEFLVRRDELTEDGRPEYQTAEDTDLFIVESAIQASTIFVSFYSSDLQAISAAKLIDPLTEYLGDQAEVAIDSAGDEIVISVSQSAPIFIAAKKIFFIEYLVDHSSSDVSRNRQFRAGEREDMAGRVCSLVQNRFLRRRCVRYVSDCLADFRVPTRRDASYCRSEWERAEL